MFTQTLSLPIVVAVHGNQNCYALASILWQRALGSAVGACVIGCSFKTSSLFISNYGGNSNIMKREVSLQG